MNSKRFLMACLSAGALASTAAGAQQSAAPYAGQQQREVKSLSTAEVDDLRAGRGMGLAKPAELNAYPGPQHVLELADALQLTPDQRAATAALIAPMRAAALKHGAEWIDRERELDRLFASSTATPDALRDALQRSADAMARVRAAHLEAHIAQRALLTPEQVTAYQHLRGYGSASAPGADHAARHGGHGHHGR